MKKKILKICLALSLVFSVLAPSLVSAAPVRYELHFGYTQDIATYGYNINQNGEHINKSPVGNNVYVSNNVVNLNFGQFNSYSGYQLNFSSNVDLDLTPADKYRLTGQIDFKFKPSLFQLPQRFYIQIGFDDINYNHQIIKTYTSEEISANMVNSIFTVRINDVFDAIHEDAVKNLQINFNFIYPDQDTSGNFDCTVSEFSIVPTLSEDSNNVLFAWDPLVETSSNPSIPFNQVIYQNGVSYEFGQYYSRPVYALHAKARDDKTLVPNYPYHVSGSVSIAFPDFDRPGRPITRPVKVDVVIGDQFVSHWELQYVEGLVGDYSAFQDNVLVLSFDTYGIAKQSEIDIYIRIEYLNNAAYAPPPLTDSNFQVLISPFNFRYVSSLSSEYAQYLSSQTYLSDFTKSQFGLVSPILDDALSQLGSLASAFGFVGSLVTQGISSNPFLATLFSISIAIGLGAFLFGVFTLVSGKVSKSARSSKSEASRHNGSISDRRYKQ